MNEKDHINRSGINRFRFQIITYLLIFEGKEISIRDLINDLRIPRNLFKDLLSFFNDLAKKNLFISKRSSLSIRLSFSDSVRSFLNTLAYESLQRAINRQSIFHSTIQSIRSIVSLIEEHPFTFRDLKNIFDNIKVISENTLRSYISSLKSLGILIRHPDFEAYYIDFDYIREFAYIDRFKETFSFFDRIFKIRGIQTFEIHDLSWSSKGLLKTDISGLVGNGWVPFNNNRGWKKSIDTMLGKITIIIYSNQSDQSVHNFRIDYEGSILFKNENNRIARSKFAISSNQFNDLILLIQNEIERLRISREIEISGKDFPTKFALKKIGYNLDADEDKITNEEEVFAKAIDFRDFVNGFLLRFYTYESQDGKKVRFDFHPRTENDSTALQSMFSIMNREMRSLSDIISLKEESIKSHEILENFIEENERTRENQNRFNGLVFDNLTKFNKDIYDLRENVTQIEQMVGDNNSEIQNINSTIKKRDLQIQKEIFGLNSKIESQRQSLESEIQDLGTKISLDIIGTQTFLQNELDLFQKDISSNVDNSIAIFNQIGSNLNQRISSLEGQLMGAIDTLGQTIDFVSQEDQQIFESKIDSLSNQLQTLVVDLGTIRSDLLGAIQQQTTIQTKVLESLQTNISLIEKVVEQNISNIQEEVSFINEQIILLSDLQKRQQEQSVKQNEDNNKILTMVSQNLRFLNEKMVEIEQEKKKSFFKRIFGRS